MQSDRRVFLALVGAGLSAQLLDMRQRGSYSSKLKPRAIAFDAFAIFDSTSIQTLANELFPQKGSELFNLWRLKQFEYQWLHALIGSYANFWRCTEDSLVFAARALKLDLTVEKRNDLMNSYLQLRTWPEASETLRYLKSQGIRLAFLSNATLQILQACSKNSGILELFEHVLSTDRLRTFKPSSRAYQLAIDSLALKKDDVLFVAFAGWDAAGAKAFGYPTFWVNRLNLPEEQLGFTSDGVGKNLNDLVAYLRL